MQNESLMRIRFKSLMLRLSRSITHARWICLGTCWGAKSFEYLSDRNASKVCYFECHKSRVYLVSDITFIYAVA